VGTLNWEMAAFGIDVVEVFARVLASAPDAAAWRAA
jgi:hypothetical protein